VVDIRLPITDDDGMLECKHVTGAKSDSNRES